MTEAVLNQRGQELGPKGRKTRQRIVDATRDLLQTKSLRELSAMEIARASQTSVATFYIYFVDVLSVVLALAQELSAATPDYGRYFTRPWAGETALADATAFIEHYLTYNVQHYVVVRVRNHLADEGDARFSELRSRQARPLVMALSRQIFTGGRLDAEGPEPEDGITGAVASTSLLLGMIDRLCTLLMLQPYPHRPQSRPELVAAGAQILVATVREFPQIEAAAVATAIRQIQPA